MSDEGTGLEPEQEVSESVEQSSTDETGGVVNLPGSDTASKTFDAEYVKSLREKDAEKRIKLREAEKEKADLLARLKAFEDEKLTADEKRERDYSETVERLNHYETRAKENELSFQLALAAQAEKIADVKAAVKLADRQLIEFADDGSINNLSDVIQNLRTEYPSLFDTNRGPQVPYTGVTNPAKGSGEKKYTRDDLKSMAPERINELFEAGELRHLF